MAGAKKPIPLKDEQGTIRAWACPRCYRISMSVHCGGPNGRTEEAKYSYERALECGLCRTCGAVTDCNRFAIECDQCRAKAEVLSEQFREEHREEWARQAAEHKVARERYLLGLLSDLPALQARDWSDDEDLAMDLIPILLARLATTSDQ